MMDCRTVALQQRQQGMVLIVSLIMLIVLTVVALSSTRLSSVVFRSVSGSQARSQAMLALQRTIDHIANANFTLDIPAVARTYTVAIDSGKSFDIVVAQPCMKQRIPIKNTELVLTNAEDAKCYAGGSIWSDCARTVWQLEASVNEGFFGVNAATSQGFGIRMDNASALAYTTTNSCP